jgi:hypothetical protein
MELNSSLFLLDSPIVPLFHGWWGDLFNKDFFKLFNKTVK